MAAQPIEAAGLTPEIISQLQDKATVLTQERKRRGKTMPEGLATAEALKGYKTLASHPVMTCNFETLSQLHGLIICRLCIVQVCPEF